MNSRLDHPTFANLTNLSTKKVQQLETVLAFILQLPSAQSTYAQVIDGKRTWQSYRGPNTYGFQKETTIVSGHSNPSDRALQLYEEIRTIFTPQALRLDVQLAQSYQNAPLETHEHDLRLLEITAASLNTLAGMIYAASHPGTQLRPSEASSVQLDHLAYNNDQFYVDFYHTSYVEFKRYPFGLLNVVGYWAEAQLFGGVLLFDRGESGLEINNAFVHPQRLSHAYQLSSRQIALFLGLRKTEDAGQTQSAETSLPFSKEPNAHIEITWVRAGDSPLRIYKNGYDKPPPSYVPAHSSCVQIYDEGLPVSFDEARRIVQENGWDVLQPYT